MRRIFSLALSASVWLLASCGPDPKTLRIRLFTDLDPGSELARTEARLIVEGRVYSDVERQLGRGARTMDGIEVASFTPLLHPYIVEITLWSPDDEVIAQRWLARPVEGPVDITVLITRDCIGVTCAEWCHHGACVSSACTEESHDACGPRECDSASDCPAPTVSCVEAACTPDGSCFTFAAHGQCGDEMLCDSTLGCVPLEHPDGGLADGGT